MELHVTTVCTGILLACTSLIANALAYTLTEVWPLPLNVKPFNCWGCLSFWLTLLFGAVVGLELVPYYRTYEAQVVAGYACGGVSALLGLVNFFWIKSKTIVYE